MTKFDLWFGTLNPFMQLAVIGLMLVAICAVVLICIVALSEVLS